MRKTSELSSMGKPSVGMNNNSQNFISSNPYGLQSIPLKCLVEFAKWQLVNPFTCVPKLGHELA